MPSLSFSFFQLEGDLVSGVWSALAPFGVWRAPELFGVWSPRREGVERLLDGVTGGVNIGYSFGELLIETIVGDAVR